MRGLREVVTRHDAVGIVMLAHHLQLPRVRIIASLAVPPGFQGCAGLNTSIGNKENRMETNYPSSGSKGSAGIPGTGTSGGTASTTGSSASAGSIAGGSASKGSTSAAGGMSGSGSYDDIGGTSSVSQGASHSGGQSGAMTSMSGGSGMGGAGSLRDELSSLKRDLDDLMSRATSLTDRELSDARDRMMVKFGSMKHAARGMADQARTQLNHGVDVTSDYVKEKPLQSVAIAAGVGLLVGALMRGRD